ncbi:GNAT family N-acetyltransferase [Kordia sp. YSTF-M3]|uniref:GNAT family N-acetyltransferase n=1 Tax=Kordia aestuariivivens TaxID=2759037 RepID=A0ABR7Q9Q4_9FLAO|nr:GNAT family N-acetyltransferase [Kordia aestuariivivens]MBC8755218.1 GNAT family N-acetyltransferase [Kordia aestuariivivens]
MIHIKGQFVISLLEEKDAGPLFELIQANAKRLHQYFPITAKENCSLTATEYYVQKKIREAKQKENYTFKIVTTTSQLPIGLVIIKNIHWTTKECELAYFIDSTHEGKGITSTGIGQLINYCKEELHLQKAILRIGEDNPGSLRIAEKHDFILTKRVKDGHEDFHGNIMDVLHFERTL